MREFSPNHYERAFENWLIDNRIEYTPIDEHEKTILDGSQIKSFDFLIHSRDGRRIMVEVKGRKFKGKTLEKLAGFECWVTTEDVEGLTTWQGAFEGRPEAVFVFAYQIELFDVDYDGRDVFEYDDNRYVFLGIKLEDYRRNIKRRSPKWRTVTLPAEVFRDYAIDIAELLL